MTDAFSNQDDDHWQRLGLAGLHLQIAKTVFDSPTQARPWAVALTRYAPNSESLRAIVAAGLTPDEFIAWRAGGFDSWNTVKWSKLLSENGLTHNDLRRWRSAGQGAAALPLVVQHLSDDVTSTTSWKLSRPGTRRAYWP